MSAHLGAGRGGGGDTLVLELFLEQAMKYLVYCAEAMYCRFGLTVQPLQCCTAVTVSALCFSSSVDIVT